MNYKLAYFLLAINILFISNTISAKLGDGTETHGGDSIVCFNQSYFLETKKINPFAKIVGTPQLKDFWEFSQLSQYKLIDARDDFYAGATYMQILEIIVVEINKVDSFLGSRLRKQMSNFNHYFRFSKNTVLKEVNDSDSKIKPDPATFCYEMQLAIYQAQDIPSLGYSLINQSLFDLMSERDKAGLILHELIWTEILHSKKEEKNLSYYVRYYTYLIFTENFLNATFSDYFYLKNIYQSGLFFLLPHEKIPQFRLTNNIISLIPAKNYNLETAPLQSDFTLEMLSYKGNFILPNEIREPGNYIPIIPHTIEKNQICVSLENDDLKYHGACK